MADEDLLSAVATVPVRAIGPFTIAEKYRAGQTTDDMLVTWLGDHFMQNLSGVTEDPVGEETFREYRLLKYVSDPPILPLLGGEEKARISLGQFWEVLRTADRTKWYVGYVRGRDNQIFGMHAGWMNGKGGLIIESGKLNRSYGWAVGCHFLSH